MGKGAAKSSSLRGVALHVKVRKASEFVVKNMRSNGIPEITITASQLCGFGAQNRRKY
jgi:hypothetical protein